MIFEGFDWDLGNRTKCQKHGVSVAEVESLFATQPLVGPDPTPGEARYRAIGRTEAGRGVFVVFTWRIRAGRHLVRPISARYMHRSEVERYEAIS